MDRLNEYLQTLVSTGSSELHLEPNKPPYTLSSSGTNELANAAVLGTQISMMVFPLIPNDVKKVLPDKPEVEFVHANNLGSFIFLVRKSPSGFNVTIRALELTSAGQSVPKVETSSAPAYNAIEAAPLPTQTPTSNNNFLGFSDNSPAPQANPSPVSEQSQRSFEQPTSPFLNNIHSSDTSSTTASNSVAPAEPPLMIFESVASTPQVEIMSSSTPDLLPEESNPQNHNYNPLPPVDIAPVNDPEFITQFSDTSTYVEPGNKYDYGAESDASAYVENHSMPQSYLETQNHLIEIEANPVLESPMAQYQQPQTYIPLQQHYLEVPAENAFIPAAVNPQAKKRMDDLFHLMSENKASDLHLSVSKPPVIRKDGKIQELPCNEPILTAASMRELLTSIMPAKNQEEFETRHDTDFAYEIPGLARFRANVFLDRKGMGGVFRIIPSKILTAEDLSLSKAIMDLCNLSKGLVVVTGPTGSGKSTTLCAMVDSINKKREDHIITIEDPIEFTHENHKCLVNQREVHNHTDSFKDALRAALREDPDILLVGEMRDLETISIAIETAETGHLVFGTLHTTTAASTIDRIIDQFPADRQQQIRVMLSESLKGVIAQTLLPKKGGGRVAALEVLIVTPAISNLIREGKTFQIASAMQTGRNIGMVMLNDALFEHVQKGLVEPHDAYVKAVDKTGFEALLTRNGFKL